MRISAILAVSLSLGGCATIVRGTTEQIKITSTPEAAHAALTTGQTCETPCSITVGRKEEFAVKFSKEGFEPQSIEVKTMVSGGGAAGMAGNIIFGGIIGVGTDVVSGATLDHQPNPVNADLVPVKAPVKPAPRRKGRPIS